MRRSETTPEGAAVYPSGRWDGFWEQAGFGRQPMTPFVLSFRGGAVAGSGRDVIGRFTVHGRCDPRTGEVRLVKQYLGAHRVVYVGSPDGEGCVLGTWTIDEPGRTWTGPFLLRPVVERPTGDEPIEEIK